jgi:hypothetical protein
MVLPSPNDKMVGGLAMSLVQSLFSHVVLWPGEKKERKIIPSP